MRSLAHSTASFENAIIESIEGYEGYQSPNARSVTDNRLRDYVTKSLKQIHQELSPIASRLSQFKNHGLVETFQRLVSSIKMTMQSLNNPMYRKAGFFKKAKLNSDLLAQIQDFDAQIVEKVGIFQDEIEILNQADDECEVEDMLNHLFDLIDGINQNMSEREFLILEDEH